MKLFSVDEHSAGKRADVFIADKYPDFTRSALLGLFEESLVEINKKSAKAGQKIRLGDKISVDDSLLKQTLRKIEIPIIYEDNDVIVLNKPTGVLSHSKGGINLEPTVASFIEPKITDKALSGNRAGIVHRLDRGTSGVIITARNSKSHSWLQKQFSERKVKKTYLAVVEGEPNEKNAIIDAPIARNPKRPQTFRTDPAGKAAITTYRTVKSFVKGGQKFSVLELEPQTGRTHQLRVHLAHINNPIVGDNVYGMTDGRMLLHASELELRLPGGKKENFKATTPDRIKDFINYYAT